MTCIVGYLDHKTNKVFIGGDSAGVSDYDVTIRRDKKIFHNQDFIFGCTSSFRMIQLLQFSLVPPPIGCTDMYEYMCTSFIDAVRLCFDKGGYIQKKDGTENGGTFLVGFENRLFRIDSDFQVAETTNNMDSVGCGSSYALGCLYALPETMETEDKIKKALETAAFFSAGVREPFYIISTKMESK